MSIDPVRNDFEPAHDMYLANDDHGSLRSSEGAISSADLSSNTSTHPKPNPTSASWSSRFQRSMRSDTNTSSFNSSTQTNASSPASTFQEQQIHVVSDQASPKRRRLHESDSSSNFGATSCASDNMGNSASRQLPSSSRAVEQSTTTNASANSGESSSSADTKLNAVEAGRSTPSEPEWLRKILRSQKSVPFVAVFKSVPGPGGREDLVVTPIHGHPIMQLDGTLPTTSSSSSNNDSNGRNPDEMEISAPKLPYKTQDYGGPATYHIDNDRPMMDTSSIPFELFGLIINHLSYHDVQNLRLVDKAFERSVSPHMFKRVVLPFNAGIYGILADDAQKVMLANAKGKAPATEIPPELALDMFRGFGGHIRHFGISFDVDRRALANPPPKKMREGHKAYWGRYEWCFPEYVRFSNRAALEDAADQTTIMTKALSNLDAVQHLAISLDAGLGWLKGPGGSLRDHICHEQPAVWGVSRYNTNSYLAAQRRLWLAVRETFSSAGRLNDLYWHDLVHLDNPDIQALVNAANEMHQSFTVQKTLLTNITSAQETAYKASKNMILKTALAKVPRSVWEECGLGLMFENTRSIAWDIVWTEPVLVPLKKHLLARTSISRPSEQECLSYIADAIAEGREIDPAGEEDNQALPLDNASSAGDQLSDGQSDSRRHDKLRKSLHRVRESLLETTARSKIELYSKHPRPPDGLLAVLPPPTDHDDTSWESNVNGTRVLHGPQEEWLLETAWAQDAFISTYMLSITDNRHMAANIKTLTLTRFSSKHVARLYRDDFWNALSSLTDVKLCIIADWRDVHYNISRSAVTNELPPGDAVSTVHYLLTSQLVHKRSLRKLCLGWADGGEEAEGYFARNKNVLPAPLVPREKSLNASKVFPDMPTFRYLEELRLHNCWITPNLLESFLTSHQKYSLKKLALDSVSLTAHSGLASNDAIGAHFVWGQVLVGLLPGLQSLNSAIPQPPVVIAGVQQLVRLAMFAGMQLPPNVNQFIQLHPLPLQQANTTLPGLPNLGPALIPPHQYQPVLMALDQALAPNQNQGQPFLPATVAGMNRDGIRIGSWPDLIKKVTGMLDLADKPDFEFAFLSCGYVLMPGIEFDQQWLRILSQQVEHELSDGHPNETDNDDDNIQVFPVPVHLGLHVAGVVAPQVHPIHQLQQARAVARADLTFLGEEARTRERGGRTALISRMKHVARGVQTSHDPLLGRIVSALPLQDRTTLVSDWAGIELGWPTAAMGLIEDDEVDDAGSGRDELDQNVTRGWGRWGSHTKEAAMWNGQKEGGSGRFSGRVWAREGRVITDEDDEAGDGRGGNGDGSSNVNMGTVPDAMDLA